MSGKNPTFILPQESLGDQGVVTEVKVVANERGFGEGVIGPWYEWENAIYSLAKTGVSTVYNDGYLDRDKEGARAYQNWQMLWDHLRQNAGIDLSNIG